MLVDSCCARSVRAFSLFILTLNLLTTFSIHHFLYYILYYINRDNDRKEENYRKRDNERNGDKRNGDKMNYDNEINRDNNRNNIKIEIIR